MGGQLLFGVLFPEVHIIMTVAEQSDTGHEFSSKFLESRPLIFYYSLSALCLIGTCCAFICELHKTFLIFGDFLLFIMNR